MSRSNGIDANQYPVHSSQTTRTRFNDPLGPLACEPPQPSFCAANIRGGSHAVTAALGSMLGPNFSFMPTGFPSRSSNSAGTNQDEMPGPVAIACQTSSGVPGTSSSIWTERRPEGSFFTLMMAPWVWISGERVSFSLQLGVEKVVHHRDYDGHALHQRYVGGVGQDGQSRCGAWLHVAVDLAALQAEHLRDMFEPYAIGVAVDE